MIMKSKPLFPPFAHNNNNDQMKQLYVMVDVVHVLLVVAIVQSSTHSKAEHLYIVGPYTLYL